eukprot:4183325-Pleurochrysis_carterae.AAC.1
MACKRGAHCSSASSARTDDNLALSFTPFLGAHADAVPVPLYGISSALHARACPYAYALVRSLAVHARVAAAGCFGALFKELVQERKRRKRMLKASSSRAVHAAASMERASPVIGRARVLVEARRVAGRARAHAHRPTAQPRAYARSYTSSI